MPAGDAAPQSPLSAEAVVEDGRIVDVIVRVSGKIRRLAGRAGLESEARAAQKALEAGGIPVLLGAGLGRALAALLENTDGPVVVVDKETAILRAAGLRPTEGGFSGGRDNLVRLHDPDPEAVLARLEQLDAPPTPIILPFYQRLDPAYYGRLRERLSRSRSPAPAAKRRRPGFAGDLPRVLMITSKFFLLGEAVRACERLGAPHRYIDIGGEEADFEAFTTVLADAVAAFRPDFVLTMNHLGVDREGVLVELLRRMGLPLASWFLDNPDLVLSHYHVPHKDGIALFTWDADNLESLAAQGYEHAFYLPLATDETRFRPGPPVSDAHPWRSGVSFVGNSMLLKTRLRLERAEAPSGLREALPVVARAFGRDPDRSVRNFLAGRFPEAFGLYEGLETVDRKLAYEVALVWEATRQYREECLTRLLPFSPLVVGDPGWLETLPGEGRDWRRIGELAYYDQLPLFYPCADINFNATSRQMKGAVNQRVFDVPACGAFLLTDAQVQMENLFEPEKEVAVYSHPDEIPDKVRFYLDRPEERRRIAQAARRRVLAEHTYPLRLRKLFAVMKKTFAAG